MKRMQKLLTATYPVLFAIYLILFTYAQNIGQATLGDGFLIGGLSIASVIALLLLTRALYKSSVKARVTTTLVWVVFFSYGPAVKYVELILGSGYITRKLLLPLWCILLIAIIAYIARTKRNLFNIERFISVAVLFLVIMSVAEMGYKIKESSASGGLNWQKQVVKWCDDGHSLNASAASKPDIYYIILDSYSRADELKSYYGYDNSHFLDFLKKKGFYIAEKSASNYNMTNPALASSLNLDYLDTLIKETNSSPTVTINSCNSMLQRSRVVYMLRSIGYKIVSTHPQYSGIEIADSDVRLGRFCGLATDFNSSIVKKTMLESTLSGLGKSYHTSALEDLARAPHIRNPKFVFAHIMVTHVPFVYPKYTKPLNPLNDPSPGKMEGFRLYIGAMDYLNKQLTSIITAILSESSVPPIIILQADHASRRNGPILNAYYFPEGSGDKLYPSISPVNSFRVVFNSCFGTEFPLLEDEFYLHKFDKEVFIFKQAQ